MARTIFTGYAPAEGREQMKIAAKQLLPWQWPQWYQTHGSEQIEVWLKTFFHTQYAYTIDSGRSALQLVLETLSLKPGDEVLVQAYTCLVVINAIRWAGGTPVYVDCNDEYTMDPHDAERKITNRTRALIIQHTFGFPANTQALLTIARAHHLFSIEDCAHSLGGRDTNGQLLGTQADAAIFSFGSDKVVSASRGGAIITNQDRTATALAERIKTLPRFPINYVIPHLLRVITFYFGKRLHHVGIGKWFMAAMAKLGLSNRIMYTNEKQGRDMRPFPTRWPNALAALVWPQLQALLLIQAARHAQTERYANEIVNPSFSIPVNAAKYPLVRLPGLVVDPAKWHKAAKQAHISLGDWYSAVVAPNIPNSISGYTPGSCPKAEVLAAQSINLPTGPWLSPPEQGRVIAFINSFHP